MGRARAQLLVMLPLLSRIARSIWRGPNARRVYGALRTKHQSLHSKCQTLRSKTSAPCSNRAWISARASCKTLNSRSLYSKFQKKNRKRNRKFKLRSRKTSLRTNRWTAPRSDTLRLRGRWDRRPPRSRTSRRRVWSPEVARRKDAADLGSSAWTWWIRRWWTTSNSIWTKASWRSWKTSTRPAPRPFAPSASNLCPGTLLLKIRWRNPPDQITWLSNRSKK